MAARPLYALSDEELSARLSEVYAAEQALAAQRLELIAEIDGRGQPTREGATGTVVWLRDKLRVKAGSAAQMVRLASSFRRPMWIRSAGRAATRTVTGHDLHYTK